MKKTILALSGVLLMSAAATTANAQQGFSIGIKATPHFSFLQNSDDNDNALLERNATFGASFGVGAGYNFTDNMGVGLDVLYSLQGQRYEVAGVEFKQKLDYVKIPLYFSYTTNPDAPVAFTAKVGPQLSILTSAKVVDKDGDALPGMDDTKEQYQSVGFGGMAAAGVQFRLNSNMFLTAMARFDYDFTNAEDDSYMHYSKGRANTSNMTAGLEVGLKMMLP